MKHTTLSSLVLFRVLMSVNNRTQWGSTRGSENLSIQNHVENESPVCGGNNRSPEREKRF